MESFPLCFNTEGELEEALSRPTPGLVEMMNHLDGDFIFLGVSGKMGVSMACMAKRACKMAGVLKRIIGVSRFSVPGNKRYLDEQGIETLSGDLLDQNFVNALPDVSNVVYLAGTKFGTQGNEAYTWAMNAYLPGLITERYKNARMVVLSTGCIYPPVGIDSGGSKETDNPAPVGEYAQSCLGRERIFQYGSLKYDTPVILIRLNYSVEMRYGVLVDIASKVAAGEPVDISMGYVNVIWQGDANALILQSLLHCATPAKAINVTGREILSVQDVAKEFGRLFGKKPAFAGEEQSSALLSDSSWMVKHIGGPGIPVSRVIEWTAHWIKSGNRLLGKPTRFEVRDGKY